MNPDTVLDESPLWLANVDMESVPCDICGSYDAKVLFEGRDRLLGLPGRFCMVQCNKCGLIWQNPRPTQATIGAYYPPSYEPFSPAIDDEPLLRRLDRRYGMNKRCRAIIRHQASGKLLDVGCATGNFLYEMSKHNGWQVIGVEPDHHASSYARERLGLDVRTCTLREANLPADTFDVVTMWNVLEHLHHPIAELMEVYRILKTGGWFIFSIPNVEGLGAKLFGPLWMGWEMPRHLYVFPRPTLAHMLRHVGLEMVDTVCLCGSYPSFLLSLRFYLGDKAPDKAWSQWIVRLAGSLLARVLTAPLFWALDQLRQCSLITVFSRKVSTDSSQMPGISA